MRISDWSSDVCSSDLASCRVQNGTQEAASDMGPLRALRTGQANQPEHHAFGKRSFQNGELGVEIEDRKSVVSGKSGSVRVDLGGCRRINTKTNKNKLRQKAQ